MAQDLQAKDVKFRRGDYLRVQGKWAMIEDAQEDAGTVILKLGRPITDLAARCLQQEGAPNGGRMIVVCPPGSSRFPSGCMEQSVTEEGCGLFAERLVLLSEEAPFPVCWRCALLYAADRCVRIADASPEHLADAIKVSEEHMRWLRERQGDFGASA